MQAPSHPSHPLLLSREREQDLSLGSDGEAFPFCISNWMCYKHGLGSLSNIFKGHDSFIIIRNNASTIKIINLVSGHY